jgi:DNA sulfur modification protein DndD
MILDKLSLTDFRVFSGQHEIDLTPRVKYHKKRPVILFGGLNGAGKTTILTAIRLVLHGKSSLGYHISKAKYEEFLTACIHRPSDQLLKPKSANLSLSFSNATMGVIKKYTVKRLWTLDNKRVIEKLFLIEEGKLLSELTSEQCQSFLNELIPVGVADLFFFDGEKISDLAEDASGGILGDAIKKLLGLDLINTLHADLTVYLRQQSKQNASIKAQKEITILEEALFKLEQEAEQALSEYEQAKPIAMEAQENINRLNRTLAAKGGAWASSHEEDKIKQSKILTQLESTKANLQETLSSSYPLAIASDYADKVLNQLKQEQHLKQQQGASELILQHLNNLKELLSASLSPKEFKKVSPLLDQEFNATSQVNKDIELIHDISDSSLFAIKASLQNASSKQKLKAQELSTTLKNLRAELDTLGKNIARAPQQDAIKPIFDDIAIEQEKKDKSIKIQATHLEHYKSLLRQALDVARKLDKETEKIQAEGEVLRSVAFANNTKSLLSTFSEEIAKQKIKKLETAFVDSFSKLARKSDMALRAKINHKNFSVRLVSEDGREIDKNELSAGEKQIYAISILEALAKTSGRNLPFIIDTPLGRLDSVHRTHLVNEYFPSASHQVIILSTDTEVDSEFYTSLLPAISHAYRLDYNAQAKSTTVEEGYFWKDKVSKEAAIHAT